MQSSRAVGKKKKKGKLLLLFCVDLADEKIRKRTMLVLLVS